MTFVGGKTRRKRGGMFGSLSTNFSNSLKNARTSADKLREATKVHAAAAKASSAPALANAKQAVNLHAAKLTKSLNNLKVQAATACVKRATRVGGKRRRRRTRRRRRR